MCVFIFTRKKVSFYSKYNAILNLFQNRLSAIPKQVQNDNLKTIRFIYIYIYTYIY